MKQTLLIVSLAALVASCDQSSQRTGTAASAERGTEKLAPGDGQAESDKTVEEIKARVSSGLPSHFRIGEVEVTLEQAVGPSRRGVMLLPVIANEDLYKPTGKQADEHQLVQKVQEKGNSETIRFKLIGSRTQDGRWFWRDEIEEDVILHRDVKPMSFFKGALIQDSDAHLAYVKGKADEKQRRADEVAALDAKARAEKLPPIKELLQPGRKATGMVGNNYFHLAIATADPSGTSWTINANTMSKDGTKHYTDRGTVTITYDPAEREVIVKEVTLGALVGIRGSSAKVSNDALTFDKGRIATTQPFPFK
jgi:hypothetical protein